MLYRAEGTIHGSSHEEFLKRNDSSLHSAILFQQANVSLLQMANILGGFTQNLCCRLVSVACPDKSYNHQPTVALFNL